MVLFMSDLNILCGSMPHVVKVTHLRRAAALQRLVGYVRYPRSGPQLVAKNVTLRMCML
jgi:hypothetical protein